MASFVKAQQIIGQLEGGYQNDPRDQGNYYNGKLIGTNWGISAPVLAAYLNRTPSKQEMQQLSKQIAETILEERYWLQYHLDKLKNQSVATLIYDGIVNQGATAMRTMVDKTLRAFKRPIDYYRIFTRVGIGHLNKLNQKLLFETLWSIRRENYLSKRNTTFQAGWLKRLNKIKFYPNNSFASIWPFAAMIFVGVGLIILTVI